MRPSQVYPLYTTDKCMVFVITHVGTDAALLSQDLR